MTVPVGYLIFTILQILFCMVVGFVLGWALGRQDLELKQEAKMIEKWEREHPTK